MDNKHYVVAFEVGSSKIVGAVALINPNGTVEVKAVEKEYATDCVRYGCIQNVEDTKSRISRIFRKLENQIAHGKIKGVYVGVNGRSLRNIVTEVNRDLNPDSSITKEIIESIINESRSVPFTNFEILDVVPRKFIVDNSETRNPVGTFSSHICAKLNLIVAKPLIKMNLKRVFEQTTVKGYLVTPLCVADEILTSDEKQLGCMLIDFGAETTSVVIYKNNYLVYAATIPLGSRNITRDIMSLNVPEEKAEDLKKAAGNINGTSTVQNIDGVNYNDMQNHIMARVGEIIANINEQVTYAEMKKDDIGSGIVLIGGGAKLNGFTDALEQATSLKVRRGKASVSANILDTKGTDFEFIEVIGLLTKAAAIQKPTDNCVEILEEETPEVKPQTREIPEDNKSKETKEKSMIQKLKERLAGIFNEDEIEDNEDKS